MEDADERSHPQERSLDVLIPIEKSFDPLCYVLANHDLAKFSLKEATDHYYAHGINENRQQINPVILDSKSKYRKEKFLRFKECFSLPVDKSIESFPIQFGKQHNKISNYLSESANDDFGPFVDAVDNNPQKLYLDLGCGLRKRVRSNCLYLEVYPSASADIVVEPTCHYPIKDATFDGIGSFAVLEHARMPWVVVKEISRMLKPGGKVWIDWPFLVPVHGYPSHFFNATREGLRTIFEDSAFVVDDIGTGPHQGPDWALHWYLSVLAQNLPIGPRERFLDLTIKELIGTRPTEGLWNEILGHIDDHTRSTLGAGNWMVATKSG